MWYQKKMEWENNRSKERTTTEQKRAKIQRKRRNT